MFLVWIKICLFHGDESCMGVNYTLGSDLLGYSHELRWAITWTDDYGGNC